MIAAGVLVTLGLGAVGGLVLLTSTSVGQAFVVERVLRRIEGNLNGEIVISGLHSPGLHRAATLLGVRVAAADGGQVLAMDSVEAQYSVRTLLRGDLALTRLTLWRPRLTVTKEAPDQPSNLEALLSSEDARELGLGSESGLVEPGVRVFLDEVEIRDGSVDVRYPLTSGAPDASLLRTEPGPVGQGDMRVFRFHGIDGRFDGTVLADPAVDGIRMNVTGLTFEGEVFQEPVRVQDFDGRIVWAADTILVNAETVGLLGGDAGGSAFIELVDGEPDFTVDAVVEDLDLSELRWLEPRLPDARASARVGVEFGSDGLRAMWSEGRLAVYGGEVEGDGTVTVVPGGATVFQDVTLDVSAVRASALEEFIPVELPLDGRLYGDVEFSGTMDSLTVIGRMDLQEPGLGPTSGEIDGVLHLRRPLGVTGLTARLTPLDLSLLNRFAEAEGLLSDRSVSLDIQADGWTDTGIRLVAEATYPDSLSEASYVSLRGVLMEVDGEIEASLAGELSPLSLAGIFGEESPLSRLGLARGTFEAEGPWSDFVLRSDLTTEGGRLTLESSFDARSPLASYRIRGEAFDYDALEIAPQLPGGTVLSGSFDLVGEGGDLRTAELVGGMSLSNSQFADLTVDTASVDLLISNGIVTMDSLQGRIGGVSVEGGGQLAMADGGSPEELRVSFETESLEGLRPLLLVGEVIARDTLTALERQILEFEGIDPDTLPTLADVLVSGRMEGELTVGGSFENLSATGRVELEDGFFRGDGVEQAEASFSVTNLLSPERDVSVQLDAGGIRAIEREFASISASFTYREPSGNADVVLVRSLEESYQGRVAFDVEGDIRTIHLDELVFRFPEERWNLGGPSTITWDPDGLTFQDFRMRRPGSGGMRLQAQGRLPFNGAADFRLDADALDVRRIAEALQLAEVLEGVVDMDLRVTGTDTEPVMALVVSTDGFRFREYLFDRFEADVAYADQRTAGNVELWSDSLQVLTVAGELPLNLSFNAVEERIPEEVIDLVVISDQLPLSLLIAPFPSFQDVVGTISGRVDVGGTSRSLAPQGQLTLDGGGAFFSGLGVRHQNIDGTLDWFPDGRLEVDVGTRALGTARVEGTVALTTLLDPGLDLDIRFDGFQAVDRRDVTVLLSGDVRLEGSYSRPVMSGDLLVDEGTLFWDEFQRAVEVSDLFFERSAALADLFPIDAAAVGFTPVVASENPFLENIRMENTTLTVQRDSWIRSEVMDVELDGQLDVLYDRQSQDLVLDGALQAVRGSYVFGPLGLRKQFQVDGGTVRFLGTPGINPDLDLTASEPVRTPEGDRLTIIAEVTGTLVSPRVALRSDEAGFSEADLLSYLWFGRPSYALTSDQSEALGAAGALGLSTLSSGLGMAMTQGLGLDFLDYLSITQQDLGSLGSVGTANVQGTLGTTVVETGFYVADNMFLTLLFRPPAAQGSGTDNWPGIRFEWVASRGYTLQSYFEDQFFRGRALGFGATGVQTRKGLGLSIFRDWGY